MTAYAHELTSEERERLAHGARLSRPLNYGRSETQEQQRRQEAMRENKVMLRGRYEAGGREVWDVVKIANGEHTLYAKGLLYMEEAAELAVQCMRGRVCVSLAGARVLLAAGQHTLNPVRDVSPLSPRVTLVPHDGRDLQRSRLIEVRAGATPAPRLVVVDR